MLSRATNREAMSMLELEIACSAAWLYLIKKVFCGPNRGSSRRKPPAVYTLATNLQ
jgi:hypothetical protein